MLSSVDRFEIHELVQLYGHLIDERQFSRLGELFTADVEYDARQRGAELYRGLDEVRRCWDTVQHPVAHHATNVMIESIDSDRANVVNKGILVHADGSVHSNVYRQTVVRTDQGWRVSRLVMTKRTVDDIPDVS
jgi:hypothetical protein